MGGEELIKTPILIEAGGRINFKDITAAYLPVHLRPDRNTIVPGIQGLVNYISDKKGESS